MPALSVSNVNFKPLLLHKNVIRIFYVLYFIISPKRYLWYNEPPVPLVTLPSLPLLHWFTRQSDGHVTPSHACGTMEWWVKALLAIRLNPNPRRALPQWLTSKSVITHTAEDKLLSPGARLFPRPLYAPRTGIVHTHQPRIHLHTPVMHTHTSHTHTHTHTLQHTTKCLQPGNFYYVLINVFVNLFVHLSHILPSDDTHCL